MPPHVARSCSRLDPRRSTSEHDGRFRFTPSPARGAAFSVKFMRNPIRHLTLQARVNPNGAAIRSMDQSLDFARFEVVVTRVASRLRQLGVEPGQLVVTSISDRLWSWVVTLACLHEATITCTNQGNASIDPALGVDWVVTEGGRQSGFPAERTISIDADWINETLAQAPIVEPRDYPSDESVCRLVLTSGTTGDRKAVPLTCRMLDSRVSRVWTYAAVPGRELNLMPLAGIGGLYTPLMALMAGLPSYVWRSNEELPELIDRFEVAVVTASPLQVEHLVDAFEKLGRRPVSLRLLRSGGGSLPEGLAVRVRAHLCEDIMNVYGSTEAGGISVVHLNARKLPPSAAGYLLPDVAVEIVGDDDQPVPSGTSGIVRVRTPYMTAGYYRNAEATAKAFRDGWFYPGDTGLLGDNGLLVLGGRTSELINRGGVKINPEPIDHFVRGFAGVHDAAVFGLAREAGVEAVALAFVADDGLDLNALTRVLIASFGRDRAPTQFFRVKAIPRNAMGKVRRAALARGISRQLAAQAPVSEVGEPPGV